MKNVGENRWSSREEMLKGGLEKTKYVLDIMFQDGGCKMRIWQTAHYRLSGLSLMLINPFSSPCYAWCGFTSHVLHWDCRVLLYFSFCLHTQVDLLTVCCNVSLSAGNTLEILDWSFLTPCGWNFEILRSTIFYLLDGSVMTCSAWRYPFI